MPSLFRVTSKKMELPQEHALYIFSLQPHQNHFQSSLKTINHYPMAASLASYPFYIPEKKEKKGELAYQKAYTK